MFIDYGAESTLVILSEEYLPRHYPLNPPDKNGNELPVQSDDGDQLSLAVSAPASEASFPWRFLLIFLVILGLAGWGFSAFSSKLQRLGQSMVGGFNARSTSMEPYEISFKTFLKDGRKPKERKEPFEWKLVVPRTFVVSEVGSSSSISGSGDRGQENYFVMFQMTPALEPAVASTGEPLVTIRVRNGEASELIKRELHCEQMDKYREIIEARGGRKAPAAAYCRPPYGGCQIESHYRGWEMLLTFPRESPHYQKPKTGCDLVGRFLDQHTIFVDDLTK
jgi:hypothetical protein